MEDDFLESKLMKSKEDVIIIDDEQSVIDLLEMYCEELGCFRNIITATDGAIGATKLKNQSFSLILLDINMPKKSGEEIIRELKTHKGPNSVDSVLVTSGQINKGFLGDAIENGVKNFLVKPFSKEQFNEKAKKILKVTAPDLFTNS
ncbi:MAG: response regulator of citrate/malate metabolism [Bacteriovoracaceae bacterium]|jgi:response regulator of citrate/malate metabolism